MHLKYLVTLLSLQELVSALPTQLAQNAGAAPEVEAQADRKKDGGKDGKEMITSALDQVMTVLKNLDTAINNVDPKDLTTAQPLLTVAQSSSTVFQEAGAKIQAAPKLGLIDSLSIAQAGQGLGDQVKQTIGDIVKKKPVFDQLGASPLIKEQLTTQKSQTSGLQDALVSKLPAIARPIAESQAKDITKSVDDAIKAYSEPPAPPAAKPPPPRASSPPAPAPAPAPPTPAPAPAAPKPSGPPAPAPPASAPAPAPAAPKPSGPPAPAPPAPAPPAPASPASPVPKPSGPSTPAPPPSPAPAVPKPPNMD